MLVKPAISVRNVSKEFRLGELSSANTLRDAMAGWFRRKARSNTLHTSEEGYLRALDDVSFDVASGEVLGIIGPNGAGKSTLLKILSRITEPTRGEIEIRGRVASLLEVGTGFHHELTGRENIILNGSILGMKRAEIAAKFDEIVDFSGVERFLDTPVKRYSTGMQVRLAFAVAAHLEPEILIVDEVLAVGDAEFQRKCLGKMGDVAQSGRTVLFVSHNMSAVRNLCTRALLLSFGGIQEDASPEEVVRSYLSGTNIGDDHAVIDLDEEPERDFQVRRAALVSKAGEPSCHFSCDEAIRIELDLTVRRPQRELQGYMTLSRPDGQLILESDSYDTGSNQLSDLDIGSHRIVIDIPNRLLAPGAYTVYLNFSNPLGTGDDKRPNPGDVLRFMLSDVTTRRGARRRGAFSTRLGWRLGVH